MKLPVAFVQLPLLFDAGALAAEVEAIGEEHWKPHPQGFPGNSMLPLISVGGDPDDEGFAGQMLPTPHLARCAYLTQVLGELGVTLGRTRLMRLSGHAEVTRHADLGYYWAERVRVHVPIVTQPTVRFECGDSVVNMAAGECWIFDTWRQHRVLNDAERSRVHLVVDTVGGEAFWEMVRQGRGPDMPVPEQAWKPRRVAPGGEPAPLRFESANIPVVMTPWELNTRIGFLFSESVPHPQLAPFHQRTTKFFGQWQALWACHGERAEGWPDYRAALDAYMDDARRMSHQVQLRNEMLFLTALAATVDHVAVPREGRAKQGGY